MKLRSILLLLILLFCNFGCSTQPKILNREQAVQAAEELIIQNGYTDLPPSTNSELSHESGEWGVNNREEILKMRYNTLERKAYGFIDNNKGKPGWTIAFKYKNSRYNGGGRAVTMNLNGENKRMEHQDVLLNAFQKIGDS